MIEATCGRAGRLWSVRTKVRLTVKTSDAHIVVAGQVGAGPPDAVLMSEGLVRVLKDSSVKRGVEDRWNVQPRVIQGLRGPPRDMATLKHRFSALSSIICCYINHRAGGVGRIIEDNVKHVSGQTCQRCGQRSSNSTTLSKLPTTRKISQVVSTPLRIQLQSAPGSIGQFGSV